MLKISSVQSLSRVWLFATPWTAARQASLSVTNSRSPPKPTPIESMVPHSSHPPSSPSLPTPNLSQHQDLFQWVSSSHQVAKVLELHVKDQSTANVRVYSWTPIFFPAYFFFICISGFISVPLSLNYFSFVLRVEMRTLSPLTLFFSKLFLHILDHLHFHVNFRISLLISTHKKSSLDCWQGLHRICRSIWGTHFHPYILNLLIHEYRLLFHLFRSLISFKRFIPKYFLKFSFKIYFLVVLGLHCCMRTFSICDEQELLFIAEHGLVMVVTSLGAKHRL